MAKLSAHKGEFARYFSPKYRRLMSLNEDGTTLARTVSTGWKVFTHKNPEVSLDDWRRAKLEMLAKLPSWARDCKSLPSMAELERYMSDAICPTVSGMDDVEPDGYGSDGAPSWLLAVGLI